MRAKGTLSSWNDDKGYGFIEPVGSGPRVFVHITAFRDRTHRPEVGQVIKYRLGADERGRPRAEQATRPGDRARPKRRRSGVSPSVPLAAAYLLALVAIAHLGKAPWALPTIAGGVSLVTLLAYAWDKAAARQGGWRTQESTLHLLALAGGWPGAAFARQWLRHKSSKESFRAVFWFTVVVNCLLVGWLVWSEEGQALMRAYSPF